jgi:molecular chaperone GrpE
METVKNNKDVDEKNTTQEEITQEEEVVTTQDEQQITAEEEDETTEATAEEKGDAPKKKTKRGTRGGGSKVLKEENEQLKAELGEMKDKYLRVYAEFENYRRRTSKEKLDTIKLASKDSIKALLPAVDDFARAIKLSKEGDEASLPEGILLIFDKLMKSLEQQGLKVMESTGQEFDSELHEALTKIPAPTEELKGKVIDTIEQGYTLNDKIIRYAKVVVGQ